ncbi:ABC transporter substrate-binding protein [Lacibacterium aquatile]|uniref:ABC transporter substrate-binding protein n=1 Tax=Lacibacterium aquatile TaxID=1168082 RepID=A0ABW5DW85_9PROT
MVKYCRFALALVWVVVLMASLVSAAPSAYAQGTSFPRTVTDVLGRKVELKAQPKRLMLAEGFQIQTLGLLDKNPADLLVGWGGDLSALEPAIYATYLKAFPKLAEVPVVGAGTGDTFSLEKALAVSPDLAIFGAWQVPGGVQDPALQKFEAAGIPVVIIDFYRDPLKNTVESIRVLGEALGKEAAAKAYIDFYNSRMDRIRSRVAAGLPEKPTVLLHAYPGLWPCCWSAGSGGTGEFISLLGGRNIGADKFPTENGGQLNLEFVIDQDPDVYIATGLPQLKQKNTLSVGWGVDKAAARTSLAGVMEIPGIAELSAKDKGRAHGLWNFFNGSPLNILGIEALARWIQPTVFADLDPDAAMAEINRRFLAVPFEGTYWIDLKEPSRP